MLVVVLLAMIALLGLGLTGLYLTSGSVQMNSNINMRNQALYVAEAGIQTAKSVLNRTLPGNPGWTPNIGNMLGGGPPTPGQNVPLPNGLLDEIPTDPTECLGSALNGSPRRGAYLRDNPPSPPNGCGNSLAYVDCDYPNNPTVAFGAPSNDPNLPAPPTQFMGRYTLFIRQDLAECRMRLYTTENPSSNGIVVIRSEGVASDNRTRVVLEVTMATNPNVFPLPVNLVSVCPAGAAGCDDNASVQNGITVASAFTPPSGGSTAGSSGTAGAGGSGGAGGTAGTGGSSAGAGGTSPLGGSTGGGAGGGGAGGGGTGGGAGSGGCGSGSTACGNTCCPSSQSCCNNACCDGTCFSGHCCPTGQNWCNNACCAGTCSSGTCCPTNSTCNNIALLGEYGHWSTNGKFQDWLGTHNSSCNRVDTLTVHSNSNSSDNWTAKLSNYGILIVMDVFHTHAEATNNGANWWDNYKIVGSQRAFSDTEANTLRDWVKGGRGLVTMVGVADVAAEVANANKLLGKFNLGYKTDKGFGYLRGNTPTLNCWISGGFPTCPWRWISSAPLSMANVTNMQVDTGWPLKALGTGPIAFAEPLPSTTFYSWGYVGMVVDSGPVSPSGNGRVVAWADEWLTYDNDWSSTSECPATADPSTPYWKNNLNSCTQKFWNNIITWLRASCP